MTSTPQHVNPYAVPRQVSVRVKACCGVLRGEVCGCRHFAARAARLFERPLILHTKPRTAQADKA